MNEVHAYTSLLPSSNSQLYTDSKQSLKEKEQIIHKKKVID